MEYEYKGRFHRQADKSLSVRNIVPNSGLLFC